ncbi:pericentrin isoform X2 [Acinonyx jubatus]|uniref:Pericentrin isoform X2 n=1 Tax=Acinonyx jubatus TaxID=32536 RepID=A0A6J1XX18_ACIJB|nr:pericentrin isoform X2 [Acinonyx jubatus]
MDEDEQEQRRRKVEAGRAKLAHFRQRKTKGDCAHPKKKTAKRKGPAVNAPVQEESPVATEDAGLLGRGDVCKNTSCSDTPDGAGAAQPEDSDGERTGASARPQRNTDGDHPEQPQVITEALAPTSQHSVPVDLPVLDIAYSQNHTEREQECILEIAEWMRRPEDEVGTQQPVEMWQVQLQTQPVPSLELEALRLSLSNMHTAQLELTQANLQKEKETALTELRAMLNGRHAQELALLRSRQQQELGLVREQHVREQEAAALRYSRETAELKEKLQSEMEKNVRMIETLKQDWESERGLCLENLRRELSAKHQLELENLQDQFKKELAEQKAELEKIFQAKNQAEIALRTLEAQHDTDMRKLREDLQSERCQHLEDLELRLRDQEMEKQREVESLRASYEELKAQSQEEIRRLWSQLESVRPNRQDLTELPDQLLAHAPHVEGLGHLKQDFQQQQQQREKTEHESELEQLRIYFEQKLKDAEKSYQEDLILLQQRLQEANEESFLESVDISAFLEERSEKRRREHVDGPSLQSELEAAHWRQLAALKSSLEGRQEVDLAGPQVMEGEQHTGFSEGPDEELARVPLLCAQDTASEVETEVAARVLSLEAEHKLKLSFLQSELKEEIDALKLENRNLHERLRHEIRLKEDLERVKYNLVEDHQEELKKAKEKIQLMKQEFKEREEEWKVTSEGLKRKAEEEVTLMLLDLREQAESEKQLIINKFELREIKMRQLQDQQAAQILELEGSLVEQQGRLRQLELGLAGDEFPQCIHCGREPGGGLAPVDKDWELATLRLKEDCALQLMLAQNRFLEERKEITEKFTAEQDALLREAQEKHAHELRLLRERHQQHVLSLTAELEARHRAQVEELRASMESEHWALLEARVAELRTKHAAAVSALEASHSSHLDSLESRHRSEMQAVREEHRRALEQLRAHLAEQLQEKDASHPAVLTREPEDELNRGRDLPPVEDSLRTPGSTSCSEDGKALAPHELWGAPQSTLIPAEVEAQGPALRAELHEEEVKRQLSKSRSEVVLEQQIPQLKGEFESEKEVALHEQEKIHRLESEQVQSLYQKEKESLFLQLQEKNNQILQLEDQILSLRHEVEECHSELEKLQQRHERENQEGTNLISMLKSDIDLSDRERRALRDTLRRLLGLFGETLKAAVTLKSRISERVGLCLEDESPREVRPSGQGPSAVPVLEETWPEAALLELDRTLPECAEVSSEAEISSHVCESFFMSPENSLECEQPIRRIYRSLGLAVDGLLELALDSTRQLEEARQIHSRFEKEFSCKNEETAQVVRKHQELLERLDEENAARTRLTLELHQARGLIEGFKVEQASLQEALGQKETAEQGLAVELESLRRQLERATQQQAELREENSVLWTQKEALATEAGEREDGIPVTIAHEDSALRREVECLTQEQLEARKQSEKDRAVLLSQMKVFEAELEEQLSRHEACAKQAEELSALRQQMAALDKHLRSQRQFMDEQAVEREHEREEFQREIQRLEEQLRQAARPRGPCVHDEQLDEEVELLQEKLREKSDGFDELVIKKELADRQVLIQEQEIKRLQETNASCRREATELREELEKQRNTVKALQQDKEALQEQRGVVSTLQSKLDEGSCPTPPAGTCPESPEVQLEAVQTALRQRESEVLDLKEQLGKIKDDLVSKRDEGLHLNVKLDTQSSRASVSLRELQEENARLKAFLQNKEKEIMCVSEQLEAQLAGMGRGTLSEVPCDRNSEIEELRSVIENLRENQQQLQKDKAEEMEQLHEVIERLQRELSLGGPAPLGAQVSELPGDPVASPEALVATGPAGRLLSEQERLHGQALEALQRRLQAAEEAAARKLAELEHSAALREAEVQGMASQIRAFEVALKAKEAKIAERDLEIDALKQQKLAHSAELETILSAFSRFRRSLEQQPLTAEDEPPELQRLRAQCVRLSRQLQVLNQRFLRCQKELDKQQARGAHLHLRAEGSSQGRGPGGEEASDDKASGQDVGTAPNSRVGDPQSAVNGDLQPAKAPVTPDHPGPDRQDRVTSVLAACQEQLESELLLVKSEMHLRMDDRGKVPGRMKNKEKLLEDCQLQKVGLISQVKELQEKLNRLVHSVNFQNSETEDFKFQQPLASSHALENNLSDSSGNGEETDKLPLVDAFHIDKTTCDLIDLSGNQDSLVRNEMPNVPMEDRVDLQDGSLCLQVSLHSGSHDLTHTQEPGPVKNALRAMDLSSWSSPEVVRKDSTLEPAPSLPLTPCSDALSLDASVQDRTSASLQADELDLLWYLGGSAAGKASRWAESPLVVDRAPSTDHHVRRTAVEKDVEDFIVTSLDAQEKPRSSPVGFEGKNSRSDNGDGLGFGDMLSQGSGRLDAPTASPVVLLPVSGRFPQPLEAMKEKEVHPKQVKALLQMVCDESHHILALSEYRGPPSALSKGEPNASLERFPREGPGLLEAIPALRRHPSPTLLKGEKEFPDMCLDWRGEFLQIVQEAFGKEREMLRAELQPRPCGSDPGDHSSLLQRLEKVVQEQEKSLEHLRLSDRSSLLSEIQALRAQLRMTHLQNQEKLQQLCAALTSAEARGSRQEHQLRRQVELLAYKVEQEKRIASDVQKTLNEEQEKASSVRKLLVVEQTVVRDLRSELRECKQDNERLLASLSEAQKEVLQLRSVLDSKESNLKAALQELESERGKERALQSRLEEEQLQHLQREGQSSKTLEELRLSLEKQHAQSNRLCVALKHEQTAKDNLQKELRIEASRCEALLAQERSQLSELRRSLEAEKDRSLELATALRHERLLTEQLSSRAQEAPAHRALLRKLKEEKSRAAELQARLEQVQRQLVADVQKQRAEIEREKEVRGTQTSAVEPAQAWEPTEGESSSQQQAGLKRSQARLAAREGHKDARRRAETRPGRADTEKRQARDKERLRELELRRQRDEHKIRQLQRTVQDLEAKEEARQRQCPESARLQEQRLSLEKVRQQLLWAAGLLTSFVSRTVDRTIGDWTSSNEKAVTSLLHMLEELKSELSAPNSSQKKMPAELQVQLVDVLLKDNDSLMKALCTVTQEKAELRLAVSQLETSLKQHLLKGRVRSRPDRSSWRQDRAVSQSSPRQPEAGLPASEDANPCSMKMEKLYLHYLRAESFRKALIYQKKYLLLLIGGFQDSEQETLSMIAHLGVFPSKADKKISTSRPFTKFRTAVRVVIAILRLRFLVKKWQEVDRKGAVVQGRAARPGFPMPRQQPPPKTSTSPPTRDASSSHTGDPVPKASPCKRERSTPSSNSKSERSLTASQDPEHSLTEYIHHLEMIQQRLGGAPPDCTSKKSCHQKIKQ